MHGSGLQPLDRENAGAYANLLLTEATGISTFRRQVLFQKDKIQPVIVARENQQVVPGPIAESPRQRPRMGHRDALQFEQIDLQQPFLIRDQLNFLDRPYGTVGGNPEIPGRLRRSRICVVPEPRKQSCDSIGTAQCLDILPSQIDVKNSSWSIVHTGA
jgi:hypothetical protein